MRKLTWSHPVAGIVLGVLTGFLLAPSMAASYVVLLPTVLIAWLGVWSGWPSALAATIACLISGGRMGMNVMLIVGVVLVVPAWGILIYAKRAKHFYTGAKMSAFMVVGAMVIALFGIWMTVQADIVDALIAGLRLSIESFGSEAMDLYFQVTQPLNGFDHAIDFAKGLTDEQRMRLLNDQMYLFESLFKDYFSSYLVTAGVFTGLASYAVAARTLARRMGKAYKGYVPLRQWFLPVEAIVVPPLAALTFYVAHTMNMQGAIDAYYTAANLALMLIMVQGFSAMERRLILLGMPVRLRRILMLTFSVIAPIVIQFSGIASALFGTHGVFRNIIDKRLKGDDN